MAENPGLEPTLIGAVSIARRLQDPLSEFVKIGPKHIGVGMYQHDLSEQKLKKALKEVLLECVSFVGKYSVVNRSCKTFRRFHMKEIGA